jgi:hypothetical protein
MCSCGCGLKASSSSGAGRSWSVREQLLKVQRPAGTQLSPA